MKIISKFWNGKLKTHLLMLVYSGLFPFSSFYVNLLSGLHVFSLCRVEWESWTFQRRSISCPEASFEKKKKRSMKLTFSKTFLACSIKKRQHEALLYKIYSLTSSRNEVITLAEINSGFELRIKMSVCKCGTKLKYEWWGPLDHCDGALVTGKGMCWC